MNAGSKSWKEFANFGGSEVDQAVPFFQGNFNGEGIYGRVCANFHQKHQLQLNNHSPGQFLGKEYQSHSLEPCILAPGQKSTPVAWRITILDHSRRKVNSSWSILFWRDSLHKSTETVDLQATLYCHPVEELRRFPRVCGNPSQSRN